MQKYYLLRTPNQYTAEVPMYKGENNTWVYLPSRAKIFSREEYVAPDKRYKYKFCKIAENTP